MYPFNAQVKEKVFRILKDVGISLTVLFATGKAFRSDVLYTEAQGQKDVLDGKIDSLRASNEARGETIRVLLSRTVNDSHDLDDIARPIWYKLYDPAGPGFRMMYMNHAYANRFGVTRFEYLGKTDIEVASDEASEWTAGDLAALRADNPVEVAENWHNHKTGEKGRSMFLKWKVVKGGDVYVYGMELYELN